MNLNVYAQAFHTILSNTLKALPSILEGLVVYGIFHIAARIVRRTVSSLTVQGKHGRKSVGLGVARLAEGSIIVLGLILALLIAVPSFNATQLVELFGLGGVAFGFAFREILQNFLAGILILLTVPFEINDQIIVGDIEGTVENIQTRATYILTYDGRRVVVPNATLITDAVTVNTAFNTRRLESTIRVAHRDDIEKAKSIILDSLTSVANPLPDPAPQVQITELALSEIVLRVRWWIGVSRRSEINECMDRSLAAIASGLQSNGIELASPITKVVLHPESRSPESYGHDQVG